MEDDPRVLFKITTTARVEAAHALDELRMNAEAALRGLFNG
jgi:hypothetical protein